MEDRDDDAGLAAVLLLALIFLTVGILIITILFYDRFVVDARHLIWR